MDPPLVNWIDSKPDVVAIEYHTWWPYAGDPFYLANPAEQADRVFFYPISVVPSIRFDGPHPPSANNPTAYEARYQERKALGSRALLGVDATYNGATRAGTATVRAIAETALAGDWRVRVAITENDIDYEAPNGINVHHHVFRKFAPDTLGAAVAFAAPYPDTITINLPYAINAGWAAENIALVAFLQEEVSREIEQGAVFRFQDEVVSVDGAGEFAGVASALVLGAARPNPFAASTSIELSLARSERVSVRVHDASGRRIRTLIDGFVAAGERSVSWDGRDASGRAVAPGAYFLRLETRTASETRRLTLLR